MKLLRGIFCAVLLALPLGVVGCGGSTPAAMSDDGGAGDGGASNLALFAPCTDNSQCASGLCTMMSYDRSPTPICTYQCDANNMNPNCPMGCNPKGYCKKPM
jgi:hypothetical protein